ncbi:winged helix-turn-helix domain-containing tetratricopeptide repeat protein [Rhizobium leguminosarum]|uniref:winged helix-turn-helix domain-containing tetratricopeptide repeat protein n=1 Tax=Rhizobium leguminosarum TaxID=384 RepID=UPI00040DE8DF|nr:winged helix-turn-helix domain-containing protein [Rhizobium leguminosarum]
MVYRIGETILDTERCTFHRAGELVQLRPKTFDLLSHMARNPDRLLTKDELFDVVWPNTIVTEDSLTQCVRDARKCIGDEEQTIIRTMPRRGYMFRFPETVAAPEPLPAAQSKNPVSSAEPMVAVLPFRLAARPELAPLFEGVVEEITNALSYFKTIAVLARHSAFALADIRPGDVRETAERFGAEYLVEGTVEEAGPALRVTVTLSETASGRRLWAHAIPFEADKVFDFQQSIARGVATTLATNIETAAMRRTPPAPSGNVAAYGHLLKAITLLRSYGETVNEEAREHLLKAIVLDPASGLAVAYLALADTIIGGYGLATPEVLDRARDRALEAISLSPDEARAHRILAVILLYRRDFAASEYHFHRALDLNPYDADTIAHMGYLLSVRGRPQEGIELHERAMQLNPMHPQWYYYDLGSTLFLLGRFREAAECHARLPRKDSLNWARLAAAYAMAGDAEQAAFSAKQGRRMSPLLTIDAILDDEIYERAEDRERLREALLRSGWQSAIDEASG